MKLYGILYGALGVILMGATIMTGINGLSPQNKAVYDDALSLQQDVDTVGFEDFKLEDYKVRFFDGNADYVVSGETIKKEPAVFTTFVGTAYEVDGDYQVILPTVENFSAMFDLLGTAGSISEGETNFTEAQYGAKEHIATLWHETLHAYQMRHYYDQLTGLLDEGAEGENIEDIIVSSVDSNQHVVELYKKQMELLNKAYDAEDLTDKKTLAAQYLELEGERRGLLDGAAPSGFTGYFNAEERWL